MELEEFLGLGKSEKPEDYNFEYENVCKDKAESYEDLGPLGRYCTYKACEITENKVKSKSVLKFIKDAKEIGYGDCDRIKLTRNIYRNLWGWNDNGKTFGPIDRIDSDLAKFGKMGPETMNSVQITLDKILSEESVIRELGIASNSESMINLYLDREKSVFLNRCVNGVKGLPDFIDSYHTIGNFVLVPKGFNSPRAQKEGIKDYWDRSLSFLKITNVESYGWNNCNFNSYINNFFLWDYVDDGRPKKISDFYFKDYLSIKDLEKFLTETNKFIKRRGKFMVAMLKINKDNPDFYTSLVKHVFNVDTIYSGYKEVIDKIKEEPFYESIKEKIDTLDSLK